MGSIHGFRCRTCGTEIVASPTLGDPLGRIHSASPVLCCGRPLASVDCDQIPATMLSVRRFAGCPLCGYRVRLIVQRSSSLTCTICFGPLVVLLEKDPKAASPLAPQPVGDLV